MYIKLTSEGEAHQKELQQNNAAPAPNHVALLLKMEAGKWYAPQDLNVEFANPSLEECVAHLYVEGYVCTIGDEE